MLPGRSLRFLAPVLFFSLLAVSAADAIFYVRKPARPAFATKEEKDLYRLRQGEIVTEGGYEKKAVWGRMVGVIKAPPEAVWQVFIHPDRWRDYRFPGIIDARTVDETIAAQAAADRRVENFYKILGGQVIDPDRSRRRGGRWPFWNFQFYNVPWPVEDKWMILKVANDEGRIGEGIYRADWTRAAGNVRTIDGYLVLDPFEGNRHETRLEYRALSDPGSHIPRFMVRWGLEREMPAIIRKIREIAERPTSSGTPPSF